MASFVEPAPHLMRGRTLIQQFFMAAIKLLMKHTAIVMDIGGTKIKMGLVAGNKIICTASIDAESSIGLKEKLPAIEKTIKCFQ